MATDRPLWIPLRAEYFNAFASGMKTVEYRRHGPGWNEDTCWPGRDVVLANGYGWTRLTAVIDRTGYVICREDGIYPVGCELIAIHLRNIRQQRRT